MILPGESIAILVDGQTIGFIEVSEEVWRLINFVDYIEVDRSGKLIPDFSDSLHGRDALARMQQLAKWVLQGVREDHQGAE